LTDVARASRGELHLDYEDFLRQHSCTQWTKDHPLAQEFIRRRISSMEDFRNFVQWAKLQNPAMSVNVGKCPLQSVIAANGALLLLDTACFLLAADFEKEGGFSERMYQQRLQKRKNKNGIA
jgi:four helix bundle suffix protein